MLQLGTEKINLTEIPLFRGVEDAALGNVRDWISYYRDGQKVCVQGEPADNLIVILRGEIQVLSRDMSMVTRRTSDVVGEQGFLSPDACRTADAFARGTVSGETKCSFIACPARCAFSGNFLEGTTTRSPLPWAVAGITVALMTNKAINNRLNIFSNNISLNSLGILITHGE